MNKNNDQVNNLLTDISSNVNTELNNIVLINTQNYNTQTISNQNNTIPTINSQREMYSQNQKYLNTSNSNINNSIDYNDYPKRLSYNSINFPDEKIRLMIKNELKNYNNNIHKNSVSKYEFNEGINDIYRYLKTFNSTLRSIQTNIDNVEKVNEKNYVNKKDYDNQITFLTDQIHKIYSTINYIGNDLKSKIDNVEYSKQLEINLFKDKINNISNDIKNINENFDSRENESKIIFLTKEEFDKNKNEINNKIREISKNSISKLDFESKIKETNNKIKEKSEKMVDNLNEKLNEIGKRIDETEKNYINKIDYDNSLRNINNKFQENENYLIKRNEFESKIKNLANKIRDIEKSNISKLDCNNKISDLEEEITSNKQIIINSIEEFKNSLEKNNKNSKEKYLELENLINKQEFELEKNKLDFESLKKKINFEALSKLNLNQLNKLNYKELIDLNYDEISSISKIKDEIELIKSINNDNEFDIKLLQNQINTHQNKINEYDLKLRKNELNIMNKRSLSHRPSFSIKNEPQNFSYQNNIDSKTIENLTKINIWISLNS